MANATVDTAGNHAVGSAAVDALCTHVEMDPIQISGLHHDRFERRNGHWAFVERSFDMHCHTTRELEAGGL
ncbi:hypothetical protein [Burkholderia cepacia]|uniref:hypothetical protein n=1 Tax=Burkholderia cepacia TaxID=292 RepID=UPI001588CCFC|nr:hypothetical protein [Burkholderia cepacia]